MGLVVSQIYVAGHDKNFSYVVYDDETSNAVIVDPNGDLDKILSDVEEKGLDLVGVLLTHTHHDHYDKLDELLRSYAIPVYVHTEGVDQIVSQSPIRPVRDRDTLLLGKQQLTVLYTPGHTVDSVCYVIDKEHAADGVPKVLTGDTLFVEGCGRVGKDDVQYLYNSLIRVKALPNETIVYPGHDYGSSKVSTIEQEKANNRFLLANDFNEFKKLRLG